MRMSRAVGMFLGSDLKPPDMIPQFGTRQQPRFGEIVEIAKDCCLVEAETCDSRGNLRVRLGTPHLAQLLQNSNAGRSGPQPGFAQEFLDFGKY